CCVQLYSIRIAIRIEPRVIVFYEMLGACGTCALAIPLLNAWQGGGQIDLWLSGSDWLWMTVMVVVCTIVAYQQYVELLKRLPVFTINFANNLEPVYGIVLALILLGESERLSPGFYVGSAAIAALVLLYSGLTNRPEHRATTYHHQAP
ncbi:MAG: DMT family transporter, partial [Planctomycetota bacterium]